MSQLQNYSDILESCLGLNGADDIESIICSYYQYNPSLPSKPIHPTTTYKPSVEETLAYLEKKKKYDKDLEVYNLQIDIYNQNLKNFENVLEQFVKQQSDFYKLPIKLKELVWALTIDDIASKHDTFCKYYIAMYDRLKVYMSVVNTAFQNIITID